MIKHWTPEEEEILLEAKINKVPLAEVADKLGRTIEAVKTRSKRLNHRMKDFTPRPNVWTEEQLALLHEDLDYDELEKLLPYSRRAIMSQCEKRGISKRFHQTSHGTADKNKPATLYLVDFGKFKKVGVTQVSLNERFKQDGTFVVLDILVTDLSTALEFEREILRNMRKFRVIGEVRRGATECFDYDCTLLEDLL